MPALIFLSRSIQKLNGNNKVFTLSFLENVLIVCVCKCKSSLELKPLVEIWQNHNQNLV